MNLRTLTRSGWLAAGLLSLSPTTDAQLNRWIPFGPEAPTITALAVHPEAPRIVFAGAGGLWKSTNRGATWTSLGGPLEHTRIETLAIAPSQPTTMYAVASLSDVYRSVDGGNSWELRSTQQGASFFGGLFVDAGDANRLYALGGPFPRLSTDGGATWTRLGGGLPAGIPRDLAVDPQRPGTAYVVFDRFGVYKTTDGGRRWFPKNTGLLPAPTPVVATALGLDPMDPRTLYLAYSPRHLFKTTDGGNRWRPVTATAVPGIVERLTVLPGTPSVLLLTTRRGIERSADGGVTFELVGQNLPRGHLLALAGSRPASNVAYAGFSGAGLYRSLDGGRSWQWARSGLPQSPIQGLVAEAGSEGSLLAGAGFGFEGDDELFRKPGEIESWRLASGGLRRTWETAFDVVAIDPSSSTTLYAGMFDGVAKSTNGGSSWSFTRRLDCLLPRTLVAVPTEPTSLFLAGTYYDSGCDFVPSPPCLSFRSLDAGGTWQCLTNNQGDLIRARSLAFDPVTPTTLYAGFGGVSKSNDSGATWQPSGVGLSGGDASALAVDPDNSDRVYAGTEDGVFRSEDGGASWAETSPGLPTGRVLSLTIDRDRLETVYAVLRFQGVFVSDNHGSSWSPLNEGLSSPNLVTGPLALDGLHSHILYVASEVGLFRFERLR